MESGAISTISHVFSIVIGLVTIASLVYGFGKLSGTNKAMLTTLTEGQESLKTKFESHQNEDTKNFKSLDKDLTEVKITIASLWPKTDKA